MDFLELWKDCTKNVVSANKLVPLNEDKQIRIGTREKGAIQTYNLYWCCDG